MLPEINFNGIEMCYTRQQVSKDLPQEPVGNIGKMSPFVSSLIPRSRNSAQQQQH